MAAGGWEWDIPFTQASLAYIAKFTSELNGLARTFASASDNAIALAVAGAIGREQLGNEKIYPVARTDIDWPNVVSKHSAILNAAGATAAEWQAAYEYIVSKGISKRSDLPYIYQIPDYGYTYFNKYTAILSDAGTIGKIRISTALDLLIKYKAAYASDDKLQLGGYFSDYKSFIADLTDSTKDTAMKVALLVVVDADKFATNSSVAYSSLTEGQRAAILVKAYATGLDTLKAQTSDKGYKQYNLAGPGSDITLYDKNLRTLYTTLGIAQPKKLEVSFDANSKSLPTDGVPTAPYVQYMTIDWAGGNSSPPDEQFYLQWYSASDSYNGGLTPFVSNVDVGQVRLDRIKKLTLTRGADSLALVGELKDPGSLVIDAGAGLDTLDLSQAVRSAGGYNVDLSALGSQFASLGNGPRLLLRNVDNVIGSTGSDNIVLVSGFNDPSKPVVGVDPLILDLNGDGITVSAYSALTSPLFDISGDGVADRTAWIAGGDGLLAQDLNSNGIIDSVGELFGNSANSGFAQLSTLDDNGDGTIDSGDIAFSSLRVWVDANSDAVTDAGELKTLAELGITSISLITRDPSPSESSVNGNDVTAIGSFTTADGVSHQIADVSLAFVDERPRQLPAAGRRPPRAHPPHGRPAHRAGGVGEAEATSSGLTGLRSERGSMYQPRRSSVVAHFLKPKTVYKELYSYQEEAVDGDLNHLQYGAPVPRALSRFNPRLIMGGGAVVSPENMPTKVVLHGPKRELPDLINRFGMLFVSRRTLDIFKTFQKSIQCFPVTVLWTDGTEAGQFFFLFTTVLLDAVDRDRTTKRWRPAPSQAAASTGVWVDEPGTTFVFRQSLMGNVHFWLDPHMSGPLLSDNLYNALRRENIEAFHETEHFLEV